MPVILKKGINKGVITKGSDPFEKRNKFCQITEGPDPIGYSDSTVSSARVMSRVDMLSILIFPSRVWLLAVNVTCAPFEPAEPQPWDAELPVTLSR